LTFVFKGDCGAGQNALHVGDVDSTPLNLSNFDLVWRAMICARRGFPFPAGRKNHQD